MRRAEHAARKQREKDTAEIKAATEEKKRLRDAGRRNAEALASAQAQLEAAAKKTRQATIGLPSAVTAVADGVGGGHLKILTPAERKLLGEEAVARRAAGSRGERRNPRRERRGARKGDFDGHRRVRAGTATGDRKLRATR